VGADVLGGEAQRLAAELGLADHVKFRGYLTQATLSDCYAGANVYVQASRHESQGVAVCEAAAAGVPLVGTNVGILSELAPTAAIAVPTSDPAALAEGVVRVLSSPEFAAVLAENAQRWAAKYTADWTAAQFESLYADVADRTVHVFP
jgi:glycosyltransferase involved in cell wall biosynthesis